MKRVIVALGLAAGLAGTARADQAAPLVFQPGAATLTWKALTGTPRIRPVELLNNTGAQQPVQFAIEVPARDDGRLLCAGACVHAAIARPLPPAGASRVALWATPTARRPADGTYTGSVAAYVAGGSTAARLSLTITVGTAATVDAKPLVDSVTTVVHCAFPNWLPFVSRDCTAGATVVVPLASGVDPGRDGKRLSLPQGTVGAVEGDSGHARVVYEGGKPETVDGGKAIKLRIDGLESTGTYEGTVDLVPADDATGDVKIKATVSDAWGWAVLMIALGTLGALLLTRSTGVKRTTRELKLRLLEARDAVRQAQQSFTEAAANHTWRDLSVEAALDDSVAGLDDKIGGLSRFSYSKADSDKVAEVEQGIAKLAAAAEQLGGLGSALDKLEVACAGLARRATPLPPTDPVHEGAPPLAGEAQPLLELGAIDLDRLASLTSTEIPEMLTLIADWQARELELSGYVRAVQSIDRKTVPDFLREYYDDAVRTLPSAWNLLWDVRTAADFTSSGVVGELEQVHVDVSYLQGRPEARRSDVSTVLLDLDTGFTLSPVLYTGRRRRGITLHRRAGIFPREALLLDEVAPTGDTVDHVRRSARLWEYLALALGFIIALVTGLEALYFGKAWGTWLDYVDALLWAFVTAGVLAVLLIPALDQLAKLSPPGRLQQRR